jgi:hypothetical protein
MISTNILSVLGLVVAIFFIYHMHLNSRVFLLNKNEAFQNLTKGLGYPSKQLCKMPLTSPLPELSGPADATLDIPRKPYHLLGDYLEPAEERLANLKSECAYIANGQRYIEKTGTYGQITNNYKKKKPDNGSTLMRELSLSFYK